jgi:hypothetical protein
MLSDMTAQTVTTRRFTKEFSRLRSRTVQVTDRGRVLGVWTPATRPAKGVDFLQRATADTEGCLETTFADLLKAGKKR